MADTKKEVKEGVVISPSKKKVRTPAKRALAKRSTSLTQYLPRPKSVGRLLGWEVLRQIGQRVEVEVQPNRRRWKNGTPPKVAEVGWGIVGRRPAKGYGISLRTRDWYVKLYITAP